MSTTYNKLIAEIRLYSGRTDTEVVVAIPQFVAAAQAKLDSELRIAEMIGTQTIKASTLTITPVNVLELISVITGDYEAHQTTLAEVLRMRGFDINPPHHVFAMNGKNIELITPTDVTITAFQTPPRINQDKQTNAYTDGAENALLWLALSYLGVFARDAEMTQSWAQLASNEIERLNDSYQAYAVSGAIQEHNNEYF